MKNVVKMLVKIYCKISYILYDNKNIGFRI